MRKLALFRLELYGSGEKKCLKKEKMKCRIPLRACRA